MIDVRRVVRRLSSHGRCWGRFTCLQFLALPASDRGTILTLVKCWYGACGSLATLAILEDIGIAFGQSNSSFGTAPVRFNGISPRDTCIKPIDHLSLLYRPGALTTSRLRSTSVRESLVGGMSMSGNSPVVRASSDNP